MTIKIEKESILIKASGSTKDPKLPPHGDKAKLMFKAAMSNPAKKMRVSMGLTPDFYVFAGGAHEQQNILDCRGGSNEEVPYELDLEISHSTSEPAGKIILTVVFQELHSNLKPTRDKPITAGKDIKIRKLRDKEREILGKEIAGLRKEAGLTQVELKEEAGRSVSTISNAERGVPVSDESLLTLLSQLKDN